MRDRLSSLRFRVLLLMLLIILPAAALLVFEIVDERRHAAEDAEATALRLASSAVREQERLVERARQLLAALAFSPEVRARDVPGCEALLSRLLALFPHSPPLGVATPDGETLCGRLPGNRPVSIADSPYFQRALRGEVAISGYVTEGSTGKPAIALAHPVVDGAGVVRAVAVAGLDLSWLDRFAQGVRWPAGATLTVIDRRGLILGHSPDPGRWVGTSLPDWSQAQGALAKDGGAVETAGPDGRPVFYGFAPLRGTGGDREVLVGVGISRTGALDVAHQAIAIHVGGFGFLLLVAVATAWLGTRRLLLEPLNALVAAAGRLGAGDLSARTGLAPTGEGLGQLARAFDEMAEALERRTTELREAEDTYRVLVEQSLTGVYVFAATGKIVYANRALADMFGYGPEDSTEGPGLAEVIHPEDLPVVAARAAAQLAGDDTPGVTGFRGIRKDGGLIHCEAYGRRIVYKGHPAVLGTVLDITERKRAEETVRSQNEMLLQSEKLATMGELLGGVAHELNNPLAVIVGYASLLQAAAPAGPLAEQAEKIEQAADRCGRIVNNFLALARRRAPERRRVMLDRIIKDGVDLLAYQLRVSDITVVFHLAPDVPELWADGHQLQQVVVNLATNSYHAMREAPPPRRLTFESAFDAKHRRVLVRVADTGHGMPPDVQARAFEPFFTTKPVGVGTGLGLSMCKGIIESHGGTIRVESQPGQGTVFVIELPVGEPAAAIRTAGSAGPAAPIGARNVLVVDDEAEILSLMAQILSLDGHHVETAPNGAAALEKIRERAYDLVLSDIKMPELDGLDLYRAVGHCRPEQLRRFVFITGDALRPEVATAFEDGGAGILRKPFTPESLRRAVLDGLKGAPRDPGSRGVA